MKDMLWQSLRYSARTLIKSPSFSVVAILALALGISGNTVIFSALSAILMRPLPYEDADRLVLIWETDAGQAMTDSVVPENFFTWRQESRSFEQMAGYFPFFRLTLLGTDRPEEAMGASVTGNFFSTLGAQAAFGRTFSTAAGPDPGVVLSDGLWHRLFAADPKVIGKALHLSGEVYQVLGVMPKGFQFPEGAELWVRAPEDLPRLPMEIDPGELRQIRYMRVLARMRQGTTVPQAREELAAIHSRLDRGRSVNLVPLRNHLLGNVRPVLMVLMGAVALVLLIACINVANLLSARATGRHREMAVRLSLGAGRNHLVRQLLAESVLLALVAGALGLLLARWELSLLLKFIPVDVPRLDEIGLNGWVLVFTAGISVLTGILFGLLPALQSSSPDLVESLKDGAKGSKGPRRQRTQTSLLVWEVAMTLVLLIGTALLLQSFLGLQRVDPGFNSSRLLTFKVTLPASKYSEPAQMASFFDRLLGRLEAMPDLEAAVASLTPPPVSNDIKSAFLIEGRPAPPPDQERAEGTEFVSPHYFRALGIPLLKGREFTPQDTAEAPGVAVVSAAIAQQYWGEQDPIGQRITYDNPADPEARWFTIVGVVGDVRAVGFQQAVRPMVYRPYKQQPWPFMTLMLRTRSNPEDAVPLVRRAVAEIDPEQPIANVSPMDQTIAQAVAQPRFTLLVVAVFAVMATLLAALGIYGVAAYSVTQRQHEIGLRIALGAERRAIMGQFLRQGLWWTLLGILLGLGGALALTRVLRSLLFGVSAMDVGTYAGVSVLFIIISLLANLIPAYRASRVEPGVTLKAE